MWVRLPLCDCAEASNGCDLTFGDADRLLRLCVRREGSLLHVYTAETPAGYDRWRITLPAEEDEHIYGCGETCSRLDLRGEKVRIWAAEHQNAARITKKLLRRKLPGYDPEKKLPFRQYESYYAQPTFVSSLRYFVHADTAAFAEFDFRSPDVHRLTLEEPPELWLGQADDFSALSELLSGLLGRQPAPPAWVGDGAILAIQEGVEAVERRVQTAVEAGAAVAGVWSQDWCGCRRTGFGYQVMWNWEYDRELYPDLPERIADWHARGLRFLGYVNPFLALDGSLHREAAEKGYLVQNREGGEYLVTITTFPAAMIDLTNPAAYAWYKEIIRENMLGIGMDGWMADFGEYLPTDCVLYDGSSPARMHNLWPGIWARLNREVIAESGREGEVFFFTRAGHTQTVRSSTMMWTGDHHVDWSADGGIRSVIPATLSLAMSGFGLTHSDVGGYTTILNMTRGRELLLRWEEMNAFSPLYRFHEGNQPSRNAQFDTDDGLLRQLSLCSRLYAALAGYLRGLAEENAARGVPVMRPLFYHYDEDWAYTEETEYLLGRDVLVAPILREDADSRVCRLPEDDWIHVVTGQRCAPGTHEVSAPIGSPAVFARRSSAVCGTLLAFFRENRVLP